VSACAAKATTPIRSDVRACTKSIAVCFATSIRFAGAKSSDSMLLDTSMHSTIEIPSPRVARRADPSRGPAAAMIQAARHTLRSVTGRRAIQRRSAAPAAGRTSLMRVPESRAKRRARSHHHSGSAASASSRKGRAKLTG